MSDTASGVTLEFKPTRRRRWSCEAPPSMSDLRIVLLGTNASGNSRVGNFLLGRAAFETEEPPDVVQRVGGKHMTVINTPNISLHQMTQRVRECVSLSAPGPHVILLVLKHDQCSREEKECVEMLLNSFSHTVYQHTMMITTHESHTQVNDIIQEIIHKCNDRHFRLERNSTPAQLMEKCEEIVHSNGGHHLICGERDSFSTENTDDVRIVLLGKTGVGKSETGNTILGRNAFVAEASQQSITKECQKETAEINGRHITVIDTPGLFDTELSHEDIQREITNCISMILPGPHVFIIVLNLGQRFTQEEVKSVKIVQEMFGENSLMYTMILFTRGDYLKDKTIEQWLGKPGTPLMKLIEECGNRFHVFNNNETRDRTQVSDLLEKIDVMVTANGDSYYSCKMFRQMERERQEKQMNFMMERVETLNREREELLTKHEEEKERMMKMMEEERQNQDKEKRRREEEFNERKEQYKREITEKEANEREMRDQMKREREALKNELEVMRSEKENIKKEKDKIQFKYEIELDKLVSRIENEDMRMRQLHERNREELQKPSEEKLKLIEEKEDELKRKQAERREEYEPEKKSCTEKGTLVKGENKDFGRAAFTPDQYLNTGREQMEHLFHRLNLKPRQNIKMRAADVLQLTEHSLQSHESCAEKELAKTLIQKLLTMNYRARCIKTKPKQQSVSESSEDEIDIFYDIYKETSLSNKGTKKSDLVHPMDIQMAVFHCADIFLKQLMVTKLSQCQYALPLLVPDPFTQHIEFPLWTFRQINKSWKTFDDAGEIISKVQSVCKAQTPMVCFFRFGSVSSSKSQLMNSLINEKHNTFFHRNCPGSSRTRVLMDGVVEIAWYCPSGKDTDTFTDCVAFCNLHGDAGDNEKQLQILMEMSSVNVVLLPQINRNYKSATKIQNLYKKRKPLICLLTEDESAVIQIRKGKYRIGLKDRNPSDVSEEIRRAINDCLSVSSESSSIFRLEDVSKHSDIRVDEDDDEDCRRGKEAAQQMVRLLENKDLTQIKESFLPFQGILWHQCCQKIKEQHRPQGSESDREISVKQTEMKKIRELQHESDISEFIKHFINEMKSDAIYNMFFLKWLQIFLDEYTSTDLYALHHKYDEKCSKVLKLKEDMAKNLTHVQSELDGISKELRAATFGLEHILREIGQIYESCSSVKKNKEGLQFHFSSLPSLAAEMMISGFPLELMDGDAAHVPVIWISAVLDELIRKLGDQRVFVLSVLGVQSTGKSTMLNAMFGLQFPVSAGRCTRGAFMQLVRVSEEMKAQLKFDYILVVDTEGLRALELAGRSTRHHDNELATFVVGLGQLTLINIFGENPSEMQDTLQIVVQAFLRMKKVRLNPSCMFVHQNVSDITAEANNMEGRRRLLEKLDEMTKLADKDEVSGAESFSDVIAFNVENDVKYFAQLWEGSPPMAPPNPNYNDNVLDLKKSIISHASTSDAMLLTHLKDRIQDLWEALLDTGDNYSKWSWNL